MSEVSLRIDGREVKVEEGTTVLEAAQKIGISIPTLCYDNRLEAYGACRICTVEVEMRGRTNLVASCLYPVEPGLVVRTRSERVDRIRRTLLELMLARAPDAPTLKEYAKEYGADKNRFEKVPSFCILCGLCVRYCAEVKKVNAIGFIDRGVNREVAFIPEIAAKECWNCRECFSLCPTEYLQATFVLTLAMTNSPENKPETTK
jgi:bidirectional [NiFe] hydrogenase diaphorase subunit